MEKLVIIAGGTGSVKLVRGIASIVPQESLTVIANVGDNFKYLNLYVCPDIDTVTYALAGILDRKRGWGIRGDSFKTLEMLRCYGLETWFKLGDRDLATHLYRSWLLGQGLNLAEVTEKIRVSLGVKARIVPATNSRLETYIVTAEAGKIHLQEFWVKRGGRDKVLAVEYIGAEEANPTPEALEAIREAWGIILAPANPITSIGPTLAVPGIKEALKSSSGKVLAVSPIVGGRPFSGPAGRLMEGLGLEVSALTVAKLYREFLDIMVIDEADSHLKGKIENLGLKCFTAKTRMANLREEKRLAKTILKILGKA